MWCAEVCWSLMSSADNTIQHIQGVSSLRQLTILNLANNQVMRIEHLDHLPLTHLNLVHVHTCVLYVCCVMWVGVICGCMYVCILHMSS